MQKSPRLFIFRLDWSILDSYNGRTHKKMSEISSELIKINLLQVSLHLLLNNWQVYIIIAKHGNKFYRKNQFIFALSSDFLQDFLNDKSNQIQNANTFKCLIVV